MLQVLRTLKEQALASVDPDVADRIDQLSRENLNEFGVDEFGFDPKMVKLVAPVATWIYRNYFRVQTYGIENVPDKGRFLMIGNHSGQLPFDAFMIAIACLLEAPTPRVLRSMVERWSAELPFVSHLFVRMGQVVGDPATCRRLLDADEGVMVFPEGARGINKMYSQRYQLSEFGHGFMRLALETKSPIIPVAVVGAEEQAPAVADIKPVAKLAGLPALPVIFPQVVPLPLPVQYHIHFGEPLHFKGDPDDDDEVIAGHVKKVKNTITRMLQRGLEMRESVF
ncbi:MAG: acyltransferase family protein [Deltaproteobacteria bacterium]|nr:acyltransferase family protein [Deltaproteobacteria bacterium]